MSTMTAMDVVSPTSSSTTTYASVIGFFISISGLSFSVAGSGKLSDAPSLVEIGDAREFGESGDFGDFAEIEEIDDFADIGESPMWTIIVPNVMISASVKVDPPTNVGWWIPSKCSVSSSRSKNLTVKVTDTTFLTTHETALQKVLVAAAQSEEIALRFVYMSGWNLCAITISAGSIPSLSQSNAYVRFIISDSTRFRMWAA
mmetsp:Transcript_25185/g.59794  ORF Transcript_25185/g.59794 Transcript_25185/m.59794 type:complete len:202 (-) Transcript_25185:372-977(-)